MGALPSMKAPTGAATVVGVIGHPVAHSLSPAMHNRAFRALDMDWVYVPFAVAPSAVGEAMAGLKALGVRGVNVTIPHKETVLPFMDELTDAAEAAGAVNTIVHEGGRLIGDNTDGVGFVRALRDEVDFDPQGARVLLYGAGGAAKAIAAALAAAGAGHIAIANRTESRARRLAEETARLGVETEAFGLDAETVRDALHRSDLFVQTTSVGMAGGGDADKLPAPLEPAWLHPDLVAADIVYTPLQTPLVKAALEQGCVVAPGWGMLLYQGAEAFSRWTGRPAPVETMRRALLEALEGPS